jgi:dCMP deaminase
MQKRISWEQYALNLARCALVRSEDIYKQVGACALSHDNRVLGLAYNGLQQGKNVSEEFWQDRNERRHYMIHAETNLLSLFKRNECKILASTLLPCESCARMIVAWNIPMVVYQDEYSQASKTKDIFKFYNIKLKKISCKME